MLPMALYNYLCINSGSTSKDFGNRPRYYFITDIKSIAKGVFLVYTKLDVLMTYKVELSKQVFIIDRNSNHFNMYVADNGHYARAYNISYSNVFPSGFSDMYSYVLSTVGITT